MNTEDIPQFSKLHVLRKTFEGYKDNSLHLGRKYAQIFVLGHYLFRVANSERTVSYEDNVGGQLS